jgi:hypothetical protein
MIVNVPISIGELYDKHTILLIKMKKISDREKLVIINKEFSYLDKWVSDIINSIDNTDVILQLSECHTQLVEVNNQLWNNNDLLRECEKHILFDKNFILYARKEYWLNDERALIKRKINELTLSEIQEIKSYDNCN